MKRFFILIFLFTLSLAILPRSVYAAEPTPSPIMTKSDYHLAYPGMLPDNPLYKLKILRDKITEALITDQQKKVDFYLLQADKQIAMVPLLVNKKEIALAKTTALKGENEITNLVFVYRDNGSKPNTATYQKLEKATIKHQEVLTDVMKQVSTSEAQTFQQVINFSKTNWESLDKIYDSK